MSKDLVTRSKYEIKNESAPKRKSSTTITCGCRKKIRSTQAAQSINISNYSELIDDLDNWHEISANQIPTKMQSSEKHTAMINLQIREITIREISAEFGTPKENENDDEGFGNATNEELAAFVNFFADESGFCSPNINNIKKRKASFECVLSDKVLKTDYDSAIGAAICADSSADFTPLPNDCEAEVIFNCNNEMVTNSAEHKLNNSINDNKNRVEIATTLSRSTDGKTSTASSSKSKLIIDKCARFNELELKSQIGNYKKLQYVPLADFKLNLRQRKLRTANELFNNFNRNYFGVLKHVFKQKRKVNKNIIASEYLHLLCAILEHNIDDDLAGKIFPNWNHNGIAMERERNASNMIFNTDELNYETNNNNYNINYNKNNIIINEIPVITAANQESPKLNASDSDQPNNDWSPYGVMMKLLDIWRASKSDEEINAKHFLLSSKNRINAALAFSSLLILAANNFIIITKKINSIDVQSIILGTASMELINDVQKTSTSSADRNN